MSKVTVKFTNPNSGWDYDKERCAELLTLNNEYEIESIVVLDWETELHLKGFDKPFNDANFTYCIDGKEVDRREALEEFGFERA